MDDCFKRQTSTVTPAEPGGFPWGLIEQPPARVGLVAGGERQIRITRPDARLRFTGPPPKTLARARGEQRWSTKKHPYARGRAPARADATP